MVEQNKHACKILVCPDCGARYCAEKTELMVFVPFNVKRKGRRSTARSDARE